MATSVASGKFNRRMRFQRRSEAQDSYGQQAQTWADAFTSWVSIEPMSGRELMSAQAVNAETTHKVEMRYRPGVNSALRGIYQGRVFNILAVMDEDMAHKVLTLLCSEGLIRGEDDFGIPSTDPYMAADYVADDYVQSLP